MPKRIRRAVPVWMFGKRYDFDIYELVNGAGALIALSAVQYSTSGGAAVTKQKNQIVQHFTAGHGPAEGTVDWWNTMAARPNFFCPQWDEGAHHQYGQAQPGNCPAGHGRLRGHWGSANYVVELGGDVVEVVPANYVTMHGEVVNNDSIGIEHANLGNTNLAAPPANGNEWLRLAHGTAGSNLNAGASGFPAYTEDQYRAMLLLLRNLCIEHRIPRRFLGETTAAKMKRYWGQAADSASDFSTLMRFRGVLSHMNCHVNKTCGGPAMHRNRLFRGIIDEWWLPVQFDGNERLYYTGPFDPQNNVASYFRWIGGAMLADLFRNADLDALQDTTSFFNLDHVEWYFSKTEIESQGGTFPIGVNKVWHGGVHFVPDINNRKIYAAASGTIVAARLGSDADVEGDLEYGSQRFVLIRHTVHTATEADPGGGTRTNYTPEPTYFYTLYMHLAPFAEPLTAVNNDNPPWFNYWIRHNAPRPDPNAVFCPNVEVSVGDWLGDCGTFRGTELVHFEVMSRDELSTAPWNNASFRIYDDSGSMICTSPAIDRFVQDRFGLGVDELEVLSAARDMRNVKVYHKSEWSLDGPDALRPVLPDPASRRTKWDSIRHFMWVADAVAACPDIGTHLCTAAGMMWNYHPITFMEFVNKMVLKENGQVSEPDFRKTNVTMEDAYLTRYVDFATGAAVAAVADAQKIKPFDVSNAAYEYHLKRAELACLAAGTHDPPPTPPNGTRFHFSLLDVVENIRVAFNHPIVVTLSHVCHGHNTAANVNLCVMGTADAMQLHERGHAIDIRPETQNVDQCRALWQAAHNAQTVFHASCAAHAGEPSRADLSGAVNDLTVSTRADIETHLSDGTAFNPANFVMHVALVERTYRVIWECWISRTSNATAVRLENGAMIGVFGSRADAEAERISPSFSVWPQPGGGSWEVYLRELTVATSVRLQRGGIIGVYNSVVDAEKEKGADFAWPTEI